MIQYNFTDASSSTRAIDSWTVQCPRLVRHSKGTDSASEQCKSHAKPLLSAPLWCCAGSKPLLFASECEEEGSEHSEKDPIASRETLVRF